MSHEQGAMNGHGTISGKDAFIANIATRLGRKAPLVSAPVPEARGVPDFYKQVQLDTSDLIELFREQWTALSGKVIVVPHQRAAEETAAYMEQIATEEGVTTAAIWRHEQLDKLGLADRLEAGGIETVRWQSDGGEALLTKRSAPSAAGASKHGPSRLLTAAEQCQMGVVWPDYAIANTGTLVLCAYGGRGRSVSLLPSVLFAVFKAEQLVTRMGEALAHIRSAAAADTSIGMPSSVNLITGPSRSADIENDLTIGVHGPGRVYAVIIA